MNVMNTSATINININGIAALAISATGTPVKELVTKRLMPIGGVTKPIARLTTMITPKWTGSTPNAVTIGSKIGVRIRMAGVVSITIPTKSRKTLIIIRTATLEVNVEVIAIAIACGTFISVKTRAKPSAAAMMKRIGA